MLLGNYLDAFVVMMDTTQPICKHKGRNIAGGGALIASGGRAAGHSKSASCKDAARGIGNVSAAGSNGR